MAELTDGSEPSARPSGPAGEVPGQLDPRTIRVDVRASMGIDAEPWSLSADGRPDLLVRWLDEARAVVSPALLPAEQLPPGNTTAKIGRAHV